MKKGIIVLMILFGCLSLSAQEPIVKFELNDGSIKQYNISEIDNLSILTGKSDFIMSIYYQGTQLSNYATKDVESIKFENDESNNQILNIYILGKPTGFRLFEIDSINFKISDVPLPLIISINPASGKVGDEITITGENFSTVQGSGFVSFKSKNAIDYSKWGDTEIKVIIPSGATSGMVSVTANGLKSNEAQFIVVEPNKPQIFSINPDAAKIGDIVTLTGANLGNSQGSSKVTFNGTNATEYISWADSEVKVKIPPGTSSGMVSVTVNGQKSNEVNFTVIPPGKPQISRINPSSAYVGDSVLVIGSNFGSSQDYNYVTYNGTKAVGYLNWGDSEIKVLVPANATSGKATVNIGGIKTNEVDFTVKPFISSINPTSGYIGSTVTVYGSGFGSSRGTNIISFNGTQASDYLSWNSTSIKVRIPAGAMSGNVYILVNGVTSNELYFAIIPNIVSIEPTTASSDDIVTITGTGFGNARDTGYVSFFMKDAVEYVSWGDNEIKVRVPIEAETGKLSVTASGNKSNELNFSVIPFIKGINLSSAKTGGAITITGSGFGSNKFSSLFVSFNNLVASDYDSWSNTEIKVKIPDDAESGVISVTVIGIMSNEVDFNIIPNILDINPLGQKTARAGEVITIKGTGFGSSMGSSIVSFKNINADEYPSWTNTLIKVVVPAGASTGIITVTVNDNKSNEVNFTIIDLNIISINPATLKVSDIVTITGKDFGASRGSNYVTFNNKNATVYSSWSDTQIKAKVPYGTKSGNVSVTVNGYKSNEIEFTMTGCSSEITVGSQVWMGCNLDISKYRNGDAIPQVQNATEWANLTTGAWCYYDNNAANGETYGKLYNWYAVNDARGLAPEGWHIPTDGEWTSLSNTLGGENVAGGKMKEAGTDHWLSPNTGATNSSGYTGLPGGYRSNTGTFTNMFKEAWFWASTAYSTSEARNKYLQNSNDNATRGRSNKKCGFSVRCVKD